MAGEYLVVNPRRRRRRKTTTTRKRRRRRNPMYALNARRRRRTVRRRRNPRALFGGGRTFKLFGLDVGAAAWIAGGLVGTNWLTGMAKQAIPVEFVQTRMGSIALKTGITVALATMGGALLGKKAAGLVAIGGGASVVLDLYDMVAEQTGMPALGMGEYVPEMLGEGAGGPEYEFGAVPAPNRNMWAPNWAADDDSGI